VATVVEPSHVVIAPMLSALAAAVGTLLARPFPRLQRGLSLFGSLAYLAGVAALAARVAEAGVLTYQLSGWPAPFGISMVADALAVVVLGLTAVVSLVAVAYSLSYLPTEDQRLAYHPLYHFMIVGVTGSLLTGDVFNLFVWFEVMLMASYVLVVFYSGPQHTRAGFQYAVLNLVGGALMLFAVGGLYATTGTLNMADMSRRLAAHQAYGIDPAPVLGISALLLVVFALKAGVVPFQFWVPEAYRAAPAPVTAVLAGVVKKVGIYAIIRLYFGVFAAAPLPVALPGIGGDSMLAFYGPVLLVMAAASILFGGVGAVVQPDLDGLLAYSSIGQIGYVVLPLAIAATASSSAVRSLGIAAALVYVVSHGLAKSGLFLVSGALRAGGGASRFADLGGIADRDPVLAGAFLVGSLSLVGIPPLTGFFGKLLVFDVAGRDGSTLALAVAVAGAVLTIAYVTRAWNATFWGEPVPYERRPALVAGAVVLAGLVVAVGVGFEPIMRASEAAATAALDRQGYVDAVLDGGAES
jgi:multicomponent Na+:H+ antiporter subunit D